MKSTVYGQQIQEQEKGSNIERLRQEGQRLLLEQSKQHSVDQRVRDLWGRRKPRRQHNTTTEDGTMLEHIALEDIKEAVRKITDSSPTFSQPGQSALLTSLRYNHHVSYKSMLDNLSHFQTCTVSNF